MGSTENYTKMVVGKETKNAKPKPAQYAEAWLGLVGGDAIHIHGDLLVYRDGCYRQGGKREFATWLQLELGHEWSTRVRGEGLAWLEDRCHVDPRYVDCDRRVNVKNGLLNPISGVLDEHSPSVLSTIQLPVVWNPVAVHERGERFLDEVLPDESTRKTVEEFFGYVLQRDCRYHKALMLSGEGSNGKSVLLNWLTAMLGGDDSVSALSLQNLDNRFLTGRLANKVANIFSDISHRAVDDSGVLKALIAGDEVHCDVKFKEGFSFRNTAKFIFSCNNLPAVSDVTSGYFRRWIVAPFVSEFSEANGNIDVDIEGKLVSDEGLSLLFRRSVEGLRRLDMRGGFCALEGQIGAAMAEYQSEANSVAAFVDDCCEGGEFCFRAELYKKYNEWCDEMGHRPVGGTQFVRRLRVAVPSVASTPRRERRHRGGPLGKRESVYLGVQIRVEN